MTLAVDIGNSSIKYGLFEDNGLVGTGRLIGHDIGQLAKSVSAYAFDGCIVCSTVKLEDGLMEKGLQALAPRTLMLDHTVPTPLRNLYHTPETLGMDRLAAAVGAFGQVKTDVLIIDCGTAITYDFVTAKGEFLGGNISPGLGMRLAALHTFTSRLPEVSQQGPHPTIGHDTDTAIRCGVIDGIRYEIQGYIHTFKQKYPNISIFLTGGDEFFFEDEIKKRTFADNFLVLKGLNEIFEYQNHPEKTILR